MTIYILHQEGYSFLQVAKWLYFYLCDYDQDVRLQKISTTWWVPRNQPVILVCDTTTFLNNYWYRFKDHSKAVFWTDTCLYIPRASPWKREFKGHLVVTCKYNKECLEEIGYHDVEIIPRTYNYRRARKVWLKSPEKVFDLCFIAWNDNANRKSIKELRKALEGTGLSVVAITNESGPWNRIEFSKCSEAYKYWILARSKFYVCLSKCEGFGIPPLEAMAVGTPVIYLDAPAVNEFAVGVKIPASDVKIERVSYGWVKFWYPPSPEEIRETILKALNMDKASYNDLKTRARIQAEKFNEEKVYDRLLELLGFTP